jgi:hypothetical protein
LIPESKRDEIFLHCKQELWHRQLSQKPEGDCGGDGSRVEAEMKIGLLRRPPFITIVKAADLRNTDDAPGRAVAPTVLLVHL